jgi:hypothetical protein
MRLRGASRPVSDPDARRAAPRHATESLDEPLFEDVADALAALHTNG